MKICSMDSDASTGQPLKDRPAIPELEMIAANDLIPPDNLAKLKSVIPDAFGFAERIRNP